MEEYAPVVHSVDTCNLNTVHRERKGKNCHSLLAIQNRQNSTPFSDRSCLKTQDGMWLRKTFSLIIFLNPVTCNRNNICIHIVHSSAQICTTQTKGVPWTKAKILRRRTLQFFKNRSNLQINNSKHWSSKMLVNCKHYLVSLIKNRKLRGPHF